MSDEPHTLDGFLGNRLSVAQPRRGFRAGHDSVLLAASVPAQANDQALELGSGVGVASLCLAARVGTCRITGIEIDPGLVATANENAARNDMSSRVGFLCADVRESGFTRPSFDHVFLNPPFHPASGQASFDAARDRAMRDSDDALTSWTALAFGLVRPGGSVSVILRADRVEAWRGTFVCKGVLLPLAPRQGEVPKRAIARLSPGGPASWQVLPPFVLHRADGRATEASDAVLRHGAPLTLDGPA